MHSHRQVLMLNAHTKGCELCLSAAALTQVEMNLLDVSELFLVYMHTCCSTIFGLLYPRFGYCEPICSLKSRSIPGWILLKSMQCALCFIVCGGHESWQACIGQNGKGGGNAPGFCVECCALCFAKCRMQFQQGLQIEPCRQTHT